MRLSARSVWEFGMHVVAGAVQSLPLPESFGALAAVPPRTPRSLNATSCAIALAGAKHQIPSHPTADGLFLTRTLSLQPREEAVYAYMLLFLTLSHI